MKWMRVCPSSNVWTNTCPTPPLPPPAPIQHPPSHPLNTCPTPHPPRSVAVTTSGAITTVSGFKNALTYVYNNQPNDLQAVSYEAALQFAPQSSEFVNLLAGN